MHRLSSLTLMTTLLFIMHPLGTHAAIQSGGGFTVNGQVNAAPGAVSGGGIDATISNHLTAERLSGNGYSLIGKTVYANATESTTSESVSSPVAQSGSGGIGGSTLIVPMINPQETAENERGTTNIVDLNELMVHWGSEVCGSPGDKDGDCVVGIRDFNFVLVHWETAL